MKKQISILLLLAMLTPLFASCGDTAPAAEETAPVDETIPAETEAETEYTAYTYLPADTYDGRTFTMASPSTGTRYIPGQFITEEATGDIIMDGAYERNLIVEETFDIKILHEMPADSAGFVKAARNVIMSGDAAYDLVSGFLRETSPAAIQDPLFIPKDELSWQNLDNPWYPAYLNQALDIGGNQSIFYSDMTCISLSCTYGMFYNTTMGQRYGIPDLGELALEGNWTWDKFLGYASNITTDVNGDGVYDGSDIYGNGFYYTLNYANSDTPLTLQYGMESFTTRMEDGKPVLNLNTERQVSIAERLYDLFYQENRSCLLTNGSDQCTMFANGQILFLTAIIMHAPNYMRDMEDTYIALPMPKYDEAQQSYYTIISPASSMVFGIPSSVSDKEFASVIFDALSYEGNQKVIPAFFEASMKKKYARDQLTAQVFDLLRESTYIDFGIVYDGNVGMSTLISSMMSKKSTDFASAYAALEAKALAQYDAVLESMN
ncbi:MAG: extracellular solute-binding protein [Clostridia bacterium]|nr:extracellular solute-binding protein [Clostridia bacterium]